MPSYCILLHCWNLSAYIVWAVWLACWKGIFFSNDTVMRKSVNVPNLIRKWFLWVQGAAKMKLCKHNLHIHLISATFVNHLYFKRVYWDANHTIGNIQAAFAGPSEILLPLKLGAPLIHTRVTIWHLMSVWSVWTSYRPLVNSRCLTEPHSIGAIFVHFFECRGSYPGYDTTNVGPQMLNCLWFVEITLFFNDVPQKIVQWS